MNVSDYKNEVSQILLSSDFKEQLKKKCIEAAANPSVTKITVSEGGLKDNSSKIKLYKYVAIAACLIASVSIIGTASLIGNNYFSVKSADEANLASDDFANYASDSNEPDIGLEPNAEFKSAETDSFDDDANSYDVDYIEPDALPEPAEYPEPDYTNIESPVDIDEEASYDYPYTVSNAAPTSLNAESYTGEYYTEDYILFNARQSAGGDANVYDDYKALEKNTDTDYSGYSLNQSMTLGNIDSALDNSDDVSPESYDDIPEEVKPVEGIDSDNDKSSYVFGDGVTVSYAKSYNFYDVLDNQLKDASDTLGASLVRMTIQYPVTNASVPVPKSGGYTLYSAEIDYDYLNQKSSDKTVYVWLRGTPDDQILGMPTYSEGDEIIASLFLRKDGYVTAIDELIYDVYSLNGLDLAYHRVYEDVNPGNTDMGILDVERTYLTTTENNPAIYVHKTSVKELTRYIRRKVLGENYKLCDIEELSMVSLGIKPYNDAVSANTQPEESTPVEAPAKSIKVNANDSWMVIAAGNDSIYLKDEVSTKKLEALYGNSSSGSTSDGISSTALFIGGRLSFDSPALFTGGLTEIEISNSGCPLDISFKGVRIGDSLENALTAFNINHSLESTSKITVSSETMTAILNFENGVLAKISIVSK